MSSPMLHIKPEDVDVHEKRQKYVVTVLGCRQSGVLHACLFAESGFRVICADTNQNLVNSIAKGKTPFLGQEIEIKIKNCLKTKLLDATVDVAAAVSKSDVVVITIPIEIDERKKIDYSAMENICKHVGSNLRRGSVVILTSVVGLGIMERMVKNILEDISGFKVGTDFGLAYSPTRISDGLTCDSLANQWRIVAALDKKSLNAASTILETITKDVKRIEDMKTAEAAVLFEAVLNDVNIALANELALLCEKTGIDYVEFLKLAKTGSYPKLSMPKLFGESSNESPYLLLEEAENLNTKLRILEAAREINEGMLRRALNLTKDALKSCGKTLRRARVSLLGISQMQNVRSPTKKIVKELIKALEAKGAKISLFDPYVLEDEPDELLSLSKRNMTQALEDADCILILTGHNQFRHLNLKKLKLMVKMPAAIVDFEGIIEPDKVEKEGFIYRGLGRGVWTK
jgi:nucleotide sugar dehydrogenase